MQHTKGTKIPVAELQAVQLLVSIAEKHGIESVHSIYARAVSEIYGARARDDWRDRIVESQRETFTLLEKF